MSDPAPIAPGDLPQPRLPLAKEWLSKAFADTGTAEREFANQLRPNHDAVCFRAQQAVEKVMKGLIQAQGVEPPYTHDLLELNRLLSTHYPAWNWPRTELRLLSLAAVHFRYPGVGATPQDAADALFAMRRAFAAAIKFY